MLHRFFGYSIYYFLSLQWLLWPLQSLFRIEIKPVGLTAEGMRAWVEGKDIIYVLPRMSPIDVFVLNLTLKRLGLPRAKVEARAKQLRAASLLGLSPRSGFFSVKSGDAFSNVVEHMIRRDPRVKEQRLVFVPVSVFWSRSAPKSNPNPLTRILFADDAHATVLQKMLSLFLHSRNIHVHFSTPVPFLEDAAPAAGKRIRRHIMIQLKQEQTAALGPLLYDRAAIGNTIYSMEETQSFIKNLSGNENKHIKHVFRYVDEVAADYSYTAIRAAETFFDFLWTKIFKGVRVRNFEQVSHIAKTKHVVWIPCHRSHLDYLLLPYILIKKGLTAPHVAAGVNLSFWPMGSLFRRCGAFFMRRSFSGNKLYAYVFSQYVHFLMHNSFPIEFFHEGGRSRIGKLLFPKTGLTSILMNSIIKRKAEDTYFVPVYFSYDKVMEDGSYAQELAGAKKKKETLWQMIKAIRHLGANYGQVDVSFGTPLRVGDLWNEYFSAHPVVLGHANSPVPALMSLVPNDLDPREARIQNFVRFVSVRLNQGINAAASASGGALLSAALLALPDSTVSTQLLVNRLQLLHRLVNRMGELIGWRVGTSLSTISREEDFLLSQSDSAVVTAPLEFLPKMDDVIENILSHAEQWKFLNRAPAKDVFVRNPKQEPNLWWYRGTIFHLMATVGIVGAILRTPTFGELTLQKLEVHLAAVRYLWAEELFWPDHTATGTIALAALQFLKESGVVVQWNEHCIELSQNSEDQELLKFFAALIAPEQEIYAMQIASALSLMGQTGGFNQDDLVRYSIRLHRAAFLRGVSAYTAGLSKVYALRAFDALLRAKVFIAAEGNSYEVAFTEMVKVSDFLNLRVWKEVAAIL